MKVKGSSGSTASVRALELGARRGRGRARAASSSVIASAASPAASITTMMAQVRAGCSRTCDDLRDLLGVLADDRDGLGVAGDPLALLGRVGRVDRDDDGAGASDREVARRSTPAACWHRSETRSPGCDAEVDQPAADLGDDLADLGEA